MVEAMALARGSVAEDVLVERRRREPASSDDSPSVIAVAATPGRDATALERLAIGCLRFAPIAAVDGSRGILLDIHGCERWMVRIGGEPGLLDRIEAAFRSVGITARVAIADGVVPARAWARWRPTSLQSDRAGRHDRRVIPSGATSVVWAALDPLPVESLGLEAGIVERLHQVNVRWVGDLRRLPRMALPARYGVAVGRRLDQVIGRGGDAFHESGVTVVRPVVPMLVRREFMGPVRAREAVELAVIELVESLCSRLRDAGAGVRSLRLRVEPPDSAPWIDQIELARSTRRPGHLWSVLEPILDRVPLDTGLDAIELDAVRHRPLRRRSGAMLPGVVGAGSEVGRGVARKGTRDADDAADEESLAAFIDLVEVRLGSGGVRRADPVAGHVPEDRLRLVPLDRSEEIGATQERRLEDRLRHMASPRGPRPTVWLDPPEPIGVREIEGRPIDIRWRGEDLKIVAAVGPERIGAPWWRSAIGPVAPSTGDDAGPSSSRTSAGMPDHPVDGSPLPHRAYWSVRIASGGMASGGMVSGGMAWIFRASSSGRWFLQGVWA